MKKTIATLTLLLWLTQFLGAQILAPILTGSFPSVGAITILDSTDVNATNGGVVVYTSSSGAANTPQALTGAAYVSTSMVSVATGSQSITLYQGPTAGVFASGGKVYVFSRGTPGNNITGSVTSYTSGTGVLVINVTSTNGSGTFGDGLLQTELNCSGASFIGLAAAQIGTSEVNATASDNSSETYTLNNGTGSTSGNYTAGAGTPNSGFFYTAGTVGSSAFYASLQCASCTNAFPEGAFVCLSGTATSSPIRSSNGFASTGATSFVVGNMSTISTDIVLTWFYPSDNCTTVGSPAGYTSLGTNTSNNNAAARQFYFAYKPTPASTENPTWTCNSSVHGSSGGVVIKLFGT